MLSKPGAKMPFKKNIYQETLRRTGVSIRHRWMGLAFSGALGAGFTFTLTQQWLHGLMGGLLGISAALTYIALLKMPYHHQRVLRGD